MARSKSQFRSSKRKTTSQLYNNNATFHICLLVAVSTCAFRSLLFFPFEWNGYCEHWDDRWNFQQNSQVTEVLSWNLFVRMCTSSRINVWEPFAVLLKNIIHHLFQTAHAQRCTTWIFHTLNGVVLYFLLIRILSVYESQQTLRANIQTNQESIKVSTACFIATAVWVVHPLHAEVVGWASVQPYPPSVFFGLLSLLSYSFLFDSSNLATTTTCGQRTIAIQSMSLFGCGLMFKSVILPLVPVGVIALELLLSYVCTEDFYSSSRYRYWIVYLIVAIVVGMISMNENNATDTDMVAVDGWERLVKANNMVWMYICNLIWPTKLRPHTCLDGNRGDGNNAYNLSFTPIARGSTLSAIYTCIIGCLCVLLSSKRLLALFIYIWCCFLPTAGIIQHGMVQGGGDRYAYVPFLCVPVVIASFLRKLNGKRNRVACYMCVLILLFSTSELCNQQVQIWKNDEIMLQYSLVVDPQDWRALATLIDVRRERDQDVSALITKTLNVMPRHLTTSNRLRIKIALSRARLLVLENDIESACQLYESCVVVKNDQFIEGDKNAKIMALINTAVCRCAKMQQHLRFDDSDFVNEIENILERAVLMTTESNIEQRVATAAQSNLLQFRQWQANRFVGKTLLDLLF
jgi:hypothetical protein